MMILGILFYMTILGMTMIFLFIESRFSPKKTFLAVYGLTLLMLAAEAALFCSQGIVRTIRLYSLIVHLPALLLFSFFSRHRGWRMVFQFLTVLLFCILIQQAAGLSYFLSGYRLQVLILAYAVFTALALWFLLRFLRPLVSRTLSRLRRGWGLMCLVIAAYWVIIFYLIPGLVGLEAADTFLKPLISFLMIGFYVVLVLFFFSIQKESEARHDAQIAYLSLSALKSRMEALQAAEEAVRVERHDLRHRLQTAAELASSGNLSAALDFINSAQRHLDEQKTVLWCRPPILNAVFSSYFTQAAHSGISVDAQISFPDPLPADESELAIVFANTLENSIRACMELPLNQRRIRCRVLSCPGLMFEISNPFSGAVRFDSRGLPLSEKAGHGLGTKSIAAFCKKYNAAFCYEQKDGWFSLKIIL